MICLYFDLVEIQKASLEEALEWVNDRRLCAYCGDPATDIEHVFAKTHRLPTFTVLSCQECNGMAGGELFESFIDKRDFIRARRKRRYRKLIAMPEWTEDEVNELTGRLKRHIRGSMEAKKIIEAKLSWDLLRESMCT